MTRILMIQTTSQKRICAQAEQLLETMAASNPELFILCDERDIHRFRYLPRTALYPAEFPALNHAAKNLLAADFDRAYVFWTGDKKFRWWKSLPLRWKMKNTYVIAGDGNEFRLTWKALIRHTAFRLRHPLPTDHYHFLDDIEPVPAPREGEKVLVLQSAEPPFVLQALEILRKKPQFQTPTYKIFCRNRPEIVSSFQGHPMLDKIIVHSEARNSLAHLRTLRRERFDSVVLFLTGDPSYWKIKIFAFLLGTRRILIFNEEADCFYFSFHPWLSLISHRLRVRPYSEAASKWGYSARILVSLILKSVLFPFRFLWLLCVWLRLRMTGWRLSRESHDYS